MDRVGETKKIIYMSKPMYTRDSMAHSLIMINGVGSTENGGCWESLTASEVTKLGIDPSTTANEFFLSREELIEKIKTTPTQAFFSHFIEKLGEVMLVGICGNQSVDFVIKKKVFDEKFKSEHEINATLLIDYIENWRVIS